MIGLRGIYVDDPDILGSAWDQALASDIPVVLEVKTDPEVPPLPPHITLQQAKNFSIALAKGDPDEVGVIRGAARQVLEDHFARQGLKVPADGARASASIRRLAAVATYRVRHALPAHAELIARPNLPNRSRAPARRAVAAATANAERTRETSSR